MATGFNWSTHKGQTDPVLILVKLSTVGYYPFWTEDVLLENKCVGELTVSISNYKMHLQTLFYNATVAYLAAGLV